MDIKKPCEEGKTDDCDDCPHYDVFARKCKLD